MISILPLTKQLKGVSDMKTIQIITNTTPDVNTRQIHASTEITIGTLMLHNNTFMKVTMSAVVHYVGYEISPTNIDMTLDEFNEDMNAYDEEDEEQNLIQSMVAKIDGLDCGYSVEDGDKYFKIWGE